MPKNIDIKTETHHSVNWINPKKIQIVLNGENGQGVDIFFILKRSDHPGYILILDQRRRIASQITESRVN